MKNLKSTVNEQGKTVTQILHLPETIKQGQFTKMFCKDGTMLMINDINVLCIEIFKEE